MVVKISLGGRNFVAYLNSGRNLRVYRPYCYCSSFTLPPRRLMFVGRNERPENQSNSNSDELFVSKKTGRIKYVPRVGGLAVL